MMDPNVPRQQSARNLRAISGSRACRGASLPGGRRPSQPACRGAPLPGGRRPSVGPRHSTGALERWSFRRSAGGNGSFAILCNLVPAGQSQRAGIRIGDEGKVDSKGLSKPLTSPSRPWPRLPAELGSRQSPPPQTLSMLPALASPTPQRKMDRMSPARERAQDSKKGLHSPCSSFCPHVCSQNLYSIVARNVTWYTFE
eukprot:COSAG02_NODE_989_length_15437_cov_95.731860_13_plen_199_part_00